MRRPLMCLVESHADREVWTWLWPDDRLTVGGRGCDLRVSDGAAHVASVTVDGGEVRQHMAGEVRTLHIGDTLKVHGRAWQARPPCGPRPHADADDAMSLTELGRAWIGAQGLGGAGEPVPPDLAATFHAADPATLEEAALWLALGQPGLGMEVRLRDATWTPRSPDRLGPVRFEVTTVDRMDPFSQQVERRWAEIEAVVYAGAWKVETLVAPSVAALLRSWLARRG